MQRDVAAGLFIFEWFQCAECSYPVPILARQEGYNWRHVDALTNCPLCDGSIVKPAGWYDGIGVMRTAA